MCDLPSIAIFLVIREEIRQWILFVTASLVKIVGELSHSWPKQSQLTVSRELFYTERERSVIICMYKKISYLWRNWQ